MTVAENVAYGLAARNLPRAEQDARVTEMLGLVKMQAFATRYPKQLSGGQQQRVALARALAVKPRILLLDEPFAALDKNLRLDMQIEVKRIQRLAGITTIMVTHDQEEALSMADRIAVLNQGRLEQFGSATDVYDSPGTLFVNQFVGTANMLPGKFESADATGARVALDIGIGLDARPLALPIAGGESVMACVRPESLRFSDDADAIPGTVELALLLGPLVVHEVRLSDGRFIKIAEPRAPGTPQHPSGTAVRVKPVSRSAVSVFAAPA
jgi:putative spermidine/putrescine transport system ATP-binding protein